MDREGRKGKSEGMNPQLQNHEYATSSPNRKSTLHPFSCQFYFVKIKFTPVIFTHAVN